MSLERYVQLLRAGGVVACPTETLQGLLADALSEFETALHMNPNFCLVQGYYALALSYAGRTEDSFEAAQRAIRLSPRDPGLAIFYGIAAYARFMTRQYDEAIALAREAIRHRGDRTSHAN